MLYIRRIYTLFIISCKMDRDLFGRSHHLKNKNKKKNNPSEIKRGLPGIGFKLAASGDFDITNKRLTNVADAIDPNDAVNLSFYHLTNTYLEKVIRDLQSDIQKLRVQQINDDIQFHQLLDNFREEYKSGISECRESIELLRRNSTGERANKNECSQRDYRGTLFSG